MDAAYGFGSRQIGDGAGDPKDSRVPTRGQAHGFCRLNQQAAARLVGRGMGFQQVAIEFGIRACGGSLEPCRLDCTGPCHARGDLLGAFGRRGQGEVGSAYRVYFHMQVDAVTECRAFQVNYDGSIGVDLNAKRPGFLRADGTSLVMITDAISAWCVR